MGSRACFYLCLLVCVFVGVACVACAFAWSGVWRGGFSWDGSPLQFNWHPPLMVSGMVVLHGYGAVLYRVPLTWAGPKRPWKLLHGGLMLGGRGLAGGAGLSAVFCFHQANNIPHMYSLHSWTGGAAAGVFAMQWLAGFSVFLLPCPPPWLRVLLKPFHVWMGGAVLLLSAAAAISGVNEKLFFVLKGGSNGSLPYAALPPEARLGNALGALVLGFGLLVLKILAQPDWQRPESRPEGGATRRCFKKKTRKEEENQ